ncbi:YbbR domain-containing protein [Streptococcus rupicaprae]|uniref:YbbR domain-containing protein n=1 Tax=Streptococcus rupicaprae TaxID=759619 RepID=A0ABV2FIV0_9STRE
MISKRQRSYYLAVSFVLALFLFLYASLSNFQTTSAAKTSSSETFTNTIYNVPINLSYDNEAYFISGFASDVTVQLTSSNRVTLQKESQEATRSFIVTADLNDFESGSHDIPLKIENLPTGVNATVIPASITAKIGKRVTRTLPIRAEIAADQIEEGVTISSLATKVTEAEVTTDESTMAKIDHILATLPSDQTVSENITSTVTLKAVDAEGNLLPAIISPEETTMVIKVKKASN